MHVDEGEELVPIEGGHRVLSGADVIPNGMHDRLIERRHLAGPKILRAQQAIDRAGSNAREQLAFGIGPGSSSAPVIYTGRGAIREINSWASTGSWSA